MLEMIEDLEKVTMKMKKIYQATHNEKTIIGSMSDIARRLGVTRQAVSQAILKGNRIKKYTFKLLRVFNCGNQTHIKKGGEKMNGKKIVKIDFIGLNIVFIVNRELYDNYCKRKQYYEAEMQRDAVTTMIWDKEGAMQEIIIAISGEHENVYENKALIVHEVSHAVTQIFLQYGFNDDELRSYLLQYIYLELMRFYDLYLKKERAGND